MKCTISIGSAQTLDIVGGYGDRYARQYIAEEPEHEMTIRGNGAELMEILQRLQGLPGMPEMGEVARSYPSLDPNFARKLDL
jgi:hypothetical protein